MKASDIREMQGKGDPKTIRKIYEYIEKRVKKIRSVRVSTGMVNCPKETLRNLRMMVSK